MTEQQYINQQARMGLNESKDELEAENARLREALAGMWEWQGCCQELVPDSLVVKVQAALAASEPPPADEGEKQEAAK